MFEIQIFALPGSAGILPEIFTSGRPWTAVTCCSFLRSQPAGEESQATAGSGAVFFGLLSVLGEYVGREIHAKCVPEAISQGANASPDIPAA